MKKLQKCAMFTDIHWGRKANSKAHNDDCMAFIHWFISHVKEDPSIDHIVFLGDWHETRSSLDLSTLNYSHAAASLLNDLGLPVFFLVGNHDLYHKHSRDIHSIPHFDDLPNIKIINKIERINHIEGTAVMVPYLFHDEYNILKNEIQNAPGTVFGHLEFQGFIVTGNTVKMPTGPSHKDFTGPKRVFSGHFHKRQKEGNIIYIGNAFPMDYSDADDSDRGMAVYEYRTDKLEFINWEDCPKYIKCSLSDLIDGNVTLLPKTRVKCNVDIPITFEESVEIRRSHIEMYNLRDFVLIEQDTYENLDVDKTIIQQEHESQEEFILRMLAEIKTDQIDNDRLVKMYKEL